MYHLKLKAVAIASAAGMAVAMSAGSAFAGAHSATPAMSDSPELSQALATQYGAMAAEEKVERDAADEAHFSGKAGLAAAGKTVGPDAPSSRTLGADDLAYAQSTHARIEAAYAGGAAAKHPQHLADAQTGYDCWIQEAEEGYQLVHMAQCRDKLETALAVIEKPVVMAKDKAADKPLPPTEKEFIVYFDFDSSTMNAEGMQVIDDIVEAFRGFPNPELDVVGHTDTVGSREYNRLLSKRRADAVANALTARGLSNRIIDEGALGEVLPAVETGDNVREPRNRRVVISIRNDG